MHSWVSSGALPFYIPILGCPHSSQIRCSSGLRGAAQIAQYFWQQYFGSLERVRYVLWWTEHQSLCSKLPCWNALLRWHDNSFHSNTGRICIESYTGPNNIFTETKLLSSKDAAPLPPVSVTSGDGTKLALQLCEQLLCRLVPDSPAHVVWATDKTQ